MTPIFRTLVACVAFGLVPASLANAQQPGDANKDKTNTAQSDEKTAEHNDAVLATWLHIENTNEVAIARIAQQKAQSPEVKQFAQQMITDHEAFAKKLEPFTMGKGMKGGEVGKGDSDADRLTKEAKALGEEKVAKAKESMGVHGGSMDHIQLVQDLGNKCRESATKALNEKSGAEFDKCYIGMMVMKHQEAADKISVFQNYASDRLRPTLAEGEKTVKSHLDHAKQICKQIEGQAKGDTGDKSGKAGKS